MNFHDNKKKKFYRHYQYKENIPVTYPEAGTSDATTPRPRTKLLVEADGFMHDVLANLAL